MVNEGLLNSPVFSFRLGKSEEDGGEAVFGGIDEDAYTGKLTYVPVRRRAYWEVELESVSFGDEELELESTGAAIDTGQLLALGQCPKFMLLTYYVLLGTSLIAAPSDIAEMLNTQIGAKKSWTGQYTVDCSKVPDLPEFTFNFGGNKYPLKGTDYILEVQGTCISAFMGMDINVPGGSLWIIGKYTQIGRHNHLLCFLGDAFLRRYYTVYDKGRDAVGFATAK